MNTSRPFAKLLIAALFTTGLAAFCSHSHAAEKDADESKEMNEDKGENSGSAALAKFPQPVQDAIKQIVGDNKITDADAETDNGKTTYEVDYSVKGTEYSVSVTGAGEVIEHEVTIDRSAVPTAVLDAATKAHPNSKIGEIDITQSNNKLFYELDVKTADNKYEMQINADGTVISDGVDKD